jgi:hypothetical protein
VCRPLSLRTESSRTGQRTGGACAGANARRSQSTPFTTRRAAQLLRKGGVTEPSSRFSALARDTTVRSLSPPSRRSWTLLRLRSQRGEIGRRGGRGGGVSAHVAAAHVSTWRQKS